MYEKEELIQKIQSLYKETSRIPTVEMIDNRSDMPSSSTYYREFDSWNKVLDQAGFKANKPHYNREELINHLQELSEELGGSPTIQEMIESDDRPSSTPFFKEFETWNKALEEARLETRTTRGTRK